jgi:hypothetical protein
MKTRKSHSPASKFFTRGEKVSAKTVKHHPRKHGREQPALVTGGVIMPDKRDDELSDVESLDREERGVLY